MANIGVKTVNTTSVSEIKQIVEAVAREYINNTDGNCASLPALMLRGAPGIGKSTIVRDIANQLGIGFIDIRLAQMERVDICGLPSVENGTTRWNVPEFFPTDPMSKGIILLDEITSAPLDVQVAAYSIILDRKIPNSNYSLPQGWLIIGAGNRSEDRAVVKSMSSALANRFAHFDIETNSEDWIKWAVKKSIDASVTGFIAYKPNMLFNMENQTLDKGFPTPRSWERVSNAIKVFSNSEDMLTKMVYGLIGKPTGIEFLNFRKVATKFDDVLQLLTNPKAQINIPTKLDEKYSFVMAVIYHLWRGVDKMDQTVRVEQMYKILQKLPADFGAMLAKLAVNGTDKVSQDEVIEYLTQSNGYEDFVEYYNKLQGEVSEKLEL